jgi:class 3 adenylate cyclase/uncharacterized membrane protein YhaH (DUF805 family)
MPDLETDPPGKAERHLAAILATDIVGYSRSMEKDEVGTLRRLRDIRRNLIEPKVAEHRGRVFKTMGDGFLAEFVSVLDAVHCAVDIQRLMAARNLDLPPDGRLELRIGINLGDVFREGEDVFGDGVNIAARLESIAPPGGIYISRAACDPIRERLAFDFEDLGDHHVKNITRPIQVFGVRIEGLPESVAAGDTAHGTPSPKPTVSATATATAVNEGNRDEESRLRAEGRAPPAFPEGKASSRSRGRSADTHRPEVEAAAPAEAGAIEEDTLLPLDLFPHEAHRARATFSISSIKTPGNGAAETSKVVAFEQVIRFLFSSQGRITRSQFWYKWFLPVTMINIFLLSSSAFYFNSVYLHKYGRESFIISLIWLCFWCITRWPSTVVSVKRIRDCNKSNWYALIFHAPALLIILSLFYEFFDEYYTRVSLAKYVEVNLQNLFEGYLMLSTVPKLAFMISIVVRMWFLLKFGRASSAPAPE